MARWWPSALERRIAVRYLRGQRGTRSATLQTFVGIGGITVGVMALIVVLGVMNGLRDDLRDRILVASPHIRIIPYGDGMVFRDWEDVLDQVRQVEGVVAAAPEVIAVTLVTNRSGQYSEPAKVAGLEPGVGTREVTGIDSAITEGAFVAGSIPGDSAEAGILLGFRLSQRLQAFPGDLVRLIAPTSRPSRMTGGITPIYWTMRVTGLFETGMFIYDNEFVVMDRETAQVFAGLGDDVSTISIVVDDPWQAPVVQARLREVLGPDLRVETWQEQNAALFGALELEKLGMGLVIFFIMIVAAFNIVGTFTMLVAFKTREIGILQAMGLPARSVGRIFLAQGAIIGMIGTALGLVLGLATALVVDRTGLIRIDPSIYFLDHLPIHIDPVDVVVVVVASMALAIVATIHPARRAAALTPVEAVRAE